jgi:hypothetical protein
VRTTRSTLRDRWPTLPIELGLAENVKGDRFRRTSRPSARPRGRWFCNVVLSSLTKVASGYWHVFDPLCGFRRAERDKGFGDGSRTRDIQLGRPRPLRGVAHLVEGRAFRVQLSCRRLTPGRTTHRQEPPLGDRPEPYDTHGSPTGYRETGPRRRGEGP